MSIRGKINLLVSTFVAILLVNIVLLFLSTKSVNSTNELLDLEIETTKDFSNIKYILKELQEISTDVALMGEKDGLNEIKEVKNNYIKALKEMKSMHLHKDDLEFLDNINSNFDEYYSSLYKMAQQGIKRVEARDKSKKIMGSFDASVESMEESITKMERALSKADAYRLKYEVVSTQEILTDALAMGDSEGISESKNLKRDLLEYVDSLMIKYPNAKNDLRLIKSNYIELHKNGSLMAQQGVIFEESVEAVQKSMERVDAISDKMQKYLDDIDKSKTKELRDMMIQMGDTLVSLEIKSVVGIVLLALAVIGMFIIMRNIVLSILKLQDGLVGFFGYLNKEKSTADMIDINSSDEIGHMTTMINSNIKKVEQEIESDKALIANTISVLSEFAKGDLNQKISANTTNDTMAQLKDIINNMSDSFSTNVDGILKVLKEYTNHNYMGTVDVSKVTAQLKELGLGVNELGSSITSILVENKRNGLIIEQDSDELKNNVARLNSSANQQAASLEETAASIEEMASNLTNTTEKAQSMLVISEDTKNSANRGKELANSTARAMEEINASTASIIEAITVIDQIAFQTNILSLNAAVEAATAGEAGKGFAVVAGEVRNLASRSAEAANQIKTLVDEAGGKTTEGRDISNKMIQGYEELNSKIEENTALIQDVANATKEQVGGINQINNAVGELEQATQENAKVANHTNTIAEQANKIANIIVDNANKKEFAGKNDIKIKKKMVDTDYRGEERRSVEKEMKSEDNKDKEKIEQIKSIPKDSKPKQVQPKINHHSSSNDEWESF
jgi:methyl-accepting chemotaxis protein